MYYYVSSKVVQPWPHQSHHRQRPCTEPSDYWINLLAIYSSEITVVKQHLHYNCISSCLFWVRFVEILRATKYLAVYLKTLLLGF